MRSFGASLLAEGTAFEVYLLRASELKLRILILTPVNGQRALHDLLIEGLPTCQPEYIATSDHEDLIERYHACSWKCVPPHLRDRVLLLRSFIEVTRTRVGTATLLASLVLDLVDAETMKDSKNFLKLSHVVTPPMQPRLRPELGNKTIAEAARDLFTKPAYKAIARSEHQDYLSSSGTMLERVLSSLGHLPESCPK